MLAVQLFEIAQEALYYALFHTPKSTMLEGKRALW